MVKSTFKNIFFSSNWLLLIKHQINRERAQTADKNLWFIFTNNSTFQGNCPAVISTAWKRQLVSMQHDHQFSKLPRNFCPTCPASHKLSLAATSLEAAAGFLDKIMLPRAQETHWFEALVNLQLTCLIFLGKKRWKTTTTKTLLSIYFILPVLMGWTLTFQQGEGLL